MEAEAPKQAAVAVANEGAGPTGRPGAAARRCVYGHVGGVSGLGVLGYPAVGLESPRVGNSKNLRVHNVEWRALFCRDPDAPGCPAVARDASRPAVGAGQGTQNGALHRGPSELMENLLKSSAS